MQFDGYYSSGRLGGIQVDDNHGVKKKLNHTNKKNIFQDTTSSPDPKKNAHQQNRSTESLQEGMQINLCACDGRKLLFSACLADSLLRCIYPTNSVGDFQDVSGCFRMNMYPDKGGITPANAKYKL